MSFDQDPNEQANISGADLAILVAELAESRRANAQLRDSIAAEARATVNAKRIELHARQLSEAISHLPEGLEGHLLSIDAPLSDLRETLAAIKAKE